MCVFGCPSLGGRFIFTCRQARATRSDPSGREGLAGRVIPEGVALFRGVASLFLENKSDKPRGRLRKGINALSIYLVIIQARSSKRRGRTRTCHRSRMKDSDLDEWCQLVYMDTHKPEAKNVIQTWEYYRLADGGTQV